MKIIEIYLIPPSGDRPQNHCGYRQMLHHCATVASIKNIIEKYSLIHLNIYFFAI